MNTKEKLKLIQNFFRGKEVRINGMPLIFPFIEQDAKTNLITITTENNFFLHVSPQDEVKIASEKMFIKGSNKTIVFYESSFTEEEKMSFILKDSILEFLNLDWDMYELVNDFNYSKDLKEIFTTIQKNIENLSLLVEGDNLVYESKDTNYRVYLINNKDNYSFKILEGQKIYEKKELSILLNNVLNLELV